MRVIINIILNNLFRDEEFLILTKCYSCADPTIIPYYIPPIYSPSDSYELPEATVGSNSYIINKSSIQESILRSEDMGKIVCDLKPYVTYNEQNINKSTFQCNGDAELVWVDLPAGQVSPLDPKYNRKFNNNPKWRKNENTAQEPRCSVVIPF
jgi:hypothetical protein